MTAAGYLIALGAVAVGALTQGTLGFGFGMLAAPVLAIVDEALVPGAVLVLGVTVAAIVAWDERGALDWRGIKWALVGRVFGTLAGAYAVTRLDHDAMSVVLGVLVLLAVAISLSGWHVRPTTSTLVGAGMVSGVMGTLTSVGGPPMALVYQHESGPRIRATLSAYFVVGVAISLTGLAWVGRFGLTEAALAGALLPAILIGFWVSRHTARRLDRGSLRPARGP